MCISTKIKLSEVKKPWVGVGEDEGEAEVGLDHGPEEGRSATYRLGKDQVGYTAEGHAGGFLRHTFRQRFHRLLLLYHLLLQRFPKNKK